ncbi:MAG: SsrA-binding protein SmpB [Eubacteriales bacterium]|jgi:SsrA-binding protein|nr:SsrA-binding protein SmpB [Eubacteriales bacterium]NLO35123.1 SsrA-binding protein SmpB [Clostridiaceae bacterium]
MVQQKSSRQIAENRKAYHDYYIEERMEAGLELKGTEVKSLRQGRVNLSDSYAAVRDGELWLVGMHISPYEQGNRFNHDPLRDRRLLMHKREILRLFGLVRQQGLTLVPTKLYFKFGKVKLELGLARGKKSFDKRDSEAKKQADRAIERRLKDRGRDDRD